MMSLKTTPFCGKSGTSRTLVLRSTAMSGRDELPQLAPEEKLRQLLRELGELLEVLHPRLPPLRVAGAQGGRDDGFQQARLAGGGGAEGPQVAGRDAELREPRAGDRDVDVSLAVELLPLVRVRLEEPVVLELTRELAADPGAPAELPEVEVLLAAESERPRPLAVLPAGGRRELLADHPQRQELVALEAQDRLQPLDVLLAEEPVAALRAPVLADLELVAVVQLRRLDPVPVEESSVQAAQVLDEEPAVALRQDRVLARDGDVVEEDLAVGGAADRRAVALGMEGLPRPAAARADDERG